MHVTHDGHPVRVKRLGPTRGPGVHGPPYLFVHGAGLSSESWGSLPRLCAGDGTPVVALDLPGHGMSAGPALPTIPAMAAWLNGMIEALALEHPLLIGHSMGALVALHAAARSPRAVSGLVLIGAGLRMPVAPRLLEAARQAPGQAAGLIARWAFRDGRHAGRNASPTPTMRMAARRQLGAAAPGVLASDLAACDSYADAATLAPGLAVPALVLIGAEDRMIPPAAGAALAAALPIGRSATLSACGHMPMYEAPRRAHAAMRSFVRESCS